MDQTPKLAIQRRLLYTPGSALNHLLFLTGGLLLLYLLFRTVFIGYNARFLHLTTDSITRSFFLCGLRYDLAAIFMVNGVYVVLFLLSLPVIVNKTYETILKSIFVVTNSFFALLSLIDTVYFPFTRKRLHADVFAFATGKKGGEFYRLIPRFLIEYWYVWLLFIGFVLAILFLYRKSRCRLRTENPSPKAILFSVLLILGFTAFAVIAMRGGLQMKPLNIIHASESVDAEKIPAVINTPFSVFKTFGKQTLADVNYFREDEFTPCERPERHPIASGPFTRENVVVIIVESLSREYVGCFGGSARTPFLDSLFGHSLVYVNGFANAKESIQGIPAVLAGIPAWQDDPFIFSGYSANAVTSIAGLLKKEGYSSHFFHAAGKGSMGFDLFSTLAGFDNYYAQENYPDQKDFDGEWGIWDEPYLQYMAQNLSAAPKPFVSAVFTLNTHHPFRVPEKYQGRFNRPGHPILSCVEYADFALARFFETISKEPWFQNTLFVITADHTGPHAGDSLQTSMDDYRIPVVFYRPDNSLKGVDARIANQIDILPTTMHLLGYQYPYFAFGKNLFDDNCTSFALSYRSGVYQYVDSTHCFLFNGEVDLALYDWKSDPQLSKNLLGDTAYAMVIRRCGEAVRKSIQNYNHAMIHNTMRYKD